MAISFTSKAEAITERLAEARAVKGIIKEEFTYTKKDELAALRDSIQHWQRDIIRPFKRGDTIEHVYSYQRKQYALVWKRHDSYHNAHHYQDHVRIDQSHCALCSLYLPLCQFCPLQKITGNACTYQESVYNQFINKLSPGAAKDMVNALICAYWSLINNEL